MPLILNIDTATEKAGVCLSKDGQVLGMETNPNQKDHAGFIQPAVQRVMSSVNIPLSSVDAIAVSNGPGSYTGLRVGLSTAKGLCYALHKPLILINTLQVIATAAIEALKESSADHLFCPMIDARRMEVFTAVYDNQLQEVMAPTAMILDADSFSAHLRQNKIVFNGSGAAKLEGTIENANAVFSNAHYDVSHMITTAEKMVQSALFADIAYSEPFYIKEFFTPLPKLKSD